MRLIVLCPHFDPDTAPTGRVMTRIVDELAGRGHEIHVVTSLPWYREHQIEPHWRGSLMRRETTSWGSITRVHPFPGSDRRNLVRRAAGFLGFSVLIAAIAPFAVGPRTRVHAVIAMSPPLTMGASGWWVALVRRARFVFNIQDVFPDAAVETGAITDRRLIAIARALERWSYRRSDAVTVLSEDLADNLRAKLAPAERARVRVIPNFVASADLVPRDRMTPYREELGIGDEPVVLYAGNVGFSQSLDLVLRAAAALPEVMFVINGQGAARADLERAGDGLANLRFVDYQPPERLAEVLASGDLHLVLLRAGLGRVSVPSKTYSSLAAGRPVLAAIDPGTEVTRILEESRAGISVPPDDPDAFIAALRALLADREQLAHRGEQGRRWALASVSPAGVARRYEELLVELMATPRRR